MTHAIAAARSPRQALHPEIDEAMIEMLIRRFYARVRRDADLAPIFGAVIGDDWEPHLQKMFAFWSSVMLTSGRYAGRPVPVHMAVGTIGPEHFETWLAIFRETAEEVCGADVAPLFVERAERIAGGLRIAMLLRSDGRGRHAGRVEA